MEKKFLQKKMFEIDRKIINYGLCLFVKKYKPRKPRHV